MLMLTASMEVSIPQGRFQGGYLATRGTTFLQVSIPQGRFQGMPHFPCRREAVPCFHPSRKVSRPFQISLRLSNASSFHPSRKVSRVLLLPIYTGQEVVSIPQGRFQGDIRQIAPFCYSCFHPSRKVSRFQNRQETAQHPKGFHPSRKVSRFLVPLYRGTECLVSIPQGRFQGSGTEVYIVSLKEFPSLKEGFKARRRTRIHMRPLRVSIPQGRFQGSRSRSCGAGRRPVSIPQGRFQGRSATSAPILVQHSISQSVESMQGEKAASPCKQAVIRLSKTCVDPPPFSRHRGPTHSLQEHTLKI